MSKDTKKSPQFSRIVSLAWDNQAADLLFGNPTGPVAGYHENNDSRNQSWLVTYYYDDPSIVTVSFKNETTNTYVSVSDERQDVPLTGSDQEYKWALWGLGRDISQFKTIDAKYIWVLSNDKDETPIVIKSAAEDWGRESQWVLIPTV